jgi:hypothetical protein
MSDNIMIQNIAESFTVYFRTAAETLNDINITAVEEAVKYLSEVTNRTFQNLNLLPVTAHEIRNIIITLNKRKILIVMVEYQKSY